MVGHICTDQYQDRYIYGMMGLIPLLDVVLRIRVYCWYVIIKLHFIWKSLVVNKVNMYVKAVCSCIIRCVSTGICVKKV